MNDLKRLGDRLEELANPPDGRTAENIFEAAVGGSPTRTGGGPSRRRYSAPLVAAAIVLVAGFVSLQVWEGDNAKLVTTPAGPTDMSPKQTPDQEGSAGSSANLDLEERLRNFRPDVPAREIPPARQRVVPGGGLSDDEIANMKWLISTMSEGDGERELGVLMDYANASPEAQEELRSESMPQAGERWILTIPGTGAGWVEVDQFSPDSVNEETGRGIVYRSSTGDESVGEYDGDYYYPADSSERIETHGLIVFDE